MKFNRIPKTENYEKAPAFEVDCETELYTIAATSLIDDTFYQSKDERIERIRFLTKRSDPYFVGRLAVYAREDMHLRSLPIVLAVELAKVHKGDSLVGSVVERIIKRPDEITEMLAYYTQANYLDKLRGLSKQIQKGIARAFNKFDQYQFAKYNRRGLFTLRDALFLSHAKPHNPEKKELFEKIVQNRLEAPYTWEVEISKTGEIQYESPEMRKNAFKEKWQELLESGRLGYMAILRNLNNMLKYDVSYSHMEIAAKILGDENRVRASKQFPFRFLSAYREITENASKKSNIPYHPELDYPLRHISLEEKEKVVIEALERAITASAGNIGIPREDSVLIACDVSASMTGFISKRSKVRLFEIGLLLGMMLKSRCKKVTAGIFGDSWKRIDLPSDKILSNTHILRQYLNQVGFSTNGYLVIKDLIENKIKKDRVMFFTDCQMWDSTGGGAVFSHYWTEYKTTAPDAKLYLFDLSGYGKTPVSILDNDVILVAGWSDRVFDMANAVENKEEIISHIKDIKLSIDS